MLRDMHESKARGSASMQVSAHRVETAKALVAKGLLKWLEHSVGVNFYTITEAGKAHYANQKPL